MKIVKIKVGKLLRIPSHPIYIYIVTFSNRDFPFYLHYLHFCTFPLISLVDIVWRCWKDEFLSSLFPSSGNATVTLYTAIDEAYGYIPIESMRSGIPVVAFEGGPSDTIVDGQTGYIIKSYDIDTFAQKAIQLIQDKSLYRIFSENARNHVSENFNIEKSYKDLENIFNNIISINV